jgi:hypothetical protein
MLLNSDESESMIPINVSASEVAKSLARNPNKYSQEVKQELEKMMAKPGWETQTFNDITKGKYGVAITTGPTFAIQRAEAVENMIKLVMASATASPIDKYFILKGMDFPGSDEYLEAIRKTVPPGILPAKQDDPQQQQQQQQQQMQQKQQEAQMQLEKLRLQIQVGERELQIEKMKTEHARQEVALTKMLNEAKVTDITLRREIMGMIKDLHDSGNGNIPGSTQEKGIDRQNAQNQFGQQQ